MIADIVGGSRDRIIVKAMISLARELGLQVIVEGVENLAQLRLLEEWGCDLYQGFLGAAPLDQARLARFVAAASRHRLSRLQLLRFARRQHPHQPARDLQRGQPSFACRPVAADHQLAVGAQLPAAFSRST